MSRFFPGVRGVLLAALSLASALSLAPTAFAGDYQVFTCRDGLNRSLPLADWKPEGNVIPVGEDYCGTQGYFYATLGKEQSGVDWWTGIGVTLPDGLKAMSLGAHRWARVDAPDVSDSNAAPAYSLRWGSGARWFEGGTKAVETCDLFAGCSVIHWPNYPSPNPPEITASFPGGATFVGFALACVQHGPAGGACQKGVTGRGHLRVNGFQLVVRDDAAPIIAGSAAGSLTRPGIRSGAQTLTYPAADIGAGIYQAVLEVDGREVQRISPDTTPSCVDGAGLPDTDLEFTRLQPCRRGLDVNFTLDTASFANGRHQVTSYLRDASGNLSRPVAIDADFQNAAAGPGSGGPNGTGGNPASGVLGQKGERRTLRASYGSKPSVVGKLVDASGTPIVGASLAVSEQVDVPGAPWTALGSVTTDAAGKYRFKPKTTASRRLRFVYSATVGGAEARAQREVLLAVRARMSIKATAAVVARRGLIGLSGSVRLDQLPAKGAWIEIQYRKGKAWRTIGTRRLSRRGTWTFRHRLTNLANVSLKFRSRLRPASDVPSEQTESRSVSVRIR